MNPDATRVSENSIGSLSACLVEGDPEQRRRAQKIRRRAIFLSVTLQTLTVAALIVFPLLGKGERLPSWIVVPPPPYRLSPSHPSTGPRHPIEHTSQKRFNFSNYSNIPIIRPTRRADDDTMANQLEVPGAPDGPIGVRTGVPDGIDPPRHVPKPPSDEPHVVEQHHRISVGHIDPSRLLHRLEPVYPPLCIQLHRETRVELRAIISTDGSIQSLQVISGDPFFYQSALDAVRQWRYTPTLLNDRPVEVDTHITVIYSLVR